MNAKISFVNDEQNWLSIFRIRPNILDAFITLTDELCTLLNQFIFIITRL